MARHWLKSSTSLSNGITIINKLEETKFERFLNRIVANLTTTQHAEIFSKDEKLKLEKIFATSAENLELAIKTVTYLFKRMLKFIFMPVDLKNDLKLAGLNNVKAEIFVKCWSSASRSILNELGSDIIDKQRDALHFSWKLNAELSSDCSKKCKTPKAYLSFQEKNNDTEIEMTHSELYSLYLQVESIQNELDCLM